MVIAKITIKHSHARGVRGVAAYRGSVCAMYTMRVFPCTGSNMLSKHVGAVRVF